MNAMTEEPNAEVPNRRFRYRTAFTVLEAVLLLFWVAWFYVPAVATLGD